MDRLKKIFQKFYVVSRKSREWRAFVFCLAAIVVFTTTYSMILPAITVEKNATEDVGGLVVEETAPGSTGAGAEAPGDIAAVDSESETPGEVREEETQQKEVPVADEEIAASARTEAGQTAAGTSARAETEQKAEGTATGTEDGQTAESTATEYAEEPVNGEVRTIGDRRIMTLKGKEFDVVVSGDLSVGVSDGTVLSVRGIPDPEIVRSFSDRISDELLKNFVDTKTTEVLYQLVFTDEDLVEYTPAGDFDVQFIFHSNTVSHTGEKIYAAIYDYLNDEMVLAEKNGDKYETPVISLNKNGVIMGITLKGLNFEKYSDIITLVAGPVNEELKLAAEKAAASAAADSKTESGTLTVRGRDYTVTLAYGAEAKIPENAVLEVTEIESGTSAYEKYLEQAKAAMGLDEDRVLPKELARFFDIRIMADGKEVQPAANVSVNITFDQPVVETDSPADTQIDASAVHFGKEGAEVVEVSDTDASSVEFEAESFSIYGIIYTVDFFYGEYSYTIEGGTSMLLSELIKALRIADDETAFIGRVENVEFSDEKLLRVTRIDVPTTVAAVEDRIFDIVFEDAEIEPRSTRELEAGEWLLTSLAPFSTEESLTITMDNGSRFVISVLDAQTVEGNKFITDAQLTIDGVTYGKNDTWHVYPDVGYALKLSFNEKGQNQFPKGGDTIAVDLPAGLTLVENEHHTFSIPAGLAGTITGNEYWVENGKLYIKFGEDPDDILTRSSNAHFDLDFTAEFDEGTTELPFNDKVKPNVDIDTEGSVSVSKSASYNSATGKMDYTVVVQSTGNSDNVTVRDALANTNLLKIDTSTITVSPSGTSYTIDSANEGGFNLTIPRMTHNETVTITYSADVDTSALDHKGNIKVSEDGTNSVIVDNDDHQGDDDTNTYTNRIKYSSTSKSSTTVTDHEAEDPTNETATIGWKIVLNDNYRGSIVGDQVRDSIDWYSKDAMKYTVDANGNVTLHLTARNQDGTKTYSRDVTAAVIEDSNGIQSWAYTIPQLGDDENEILSYEITYTTEVDKTRLTGDASGNAIVKNNTYNEGDDSDTGTGIVPGVGPGSGDPGEDDIVGGKTATSVTTEYIDWDIVVVVPPEGFPDGFTIVDDIPYQHQFRDTFDSIVKVTGLVNHETYTVETTQAHTYELDDVGKTRDVVTLTFYQDEAKQDPGLDDQARTITVTIRTRNDQDWIAYAETRGGGDPAYNHTNTAKVNNASPFTAVGIPLSTKVIKDLQGSDLRYVDGVQLPHYEYYIILSNVTEVPVVITDTYNPDDLVFVGKGFATDWTGHDNIAAASQMHLLNNGVDGYTAEFSDNGSGTLTITATDLPRKADGSFYEYYKIYYTMRVKDQAALDSFTQKAIENGGTYKIGNTAVWNGAEDHHDIEYTVPTVEKTGSFRVAQGQGGNDRLYDFVIDINKDKLRLNEGEPMDLTDTHTDNLTVDYTTIKVYRYDEDGRKTEDPTIQWNFNGNIGTFYNLEDETHYTIEYSCLVIGSAKQEFSNYAEMEGYHSEKHDSRDFGTEINAGANVYQIQLIKYKNGMTSERLNGATFQLFRGTGNYEWVTEGEYTWGVEEKEAMTWGIGTDTAGKVGMPITFTTGADDNPDGCVLIALNQTNHGAELEEGVHYYLKEIESPPGYQIDSSVEFWEFTLTTDPDEVCYGTERDEYNNRKWIYFYYNDVLKMNNTETEEPISVSVDKKWYEADGTLISDETLINSNYEAEFQLYQKKNNEDYAAVDTITNSDGEVLQGKITLPIRQDDDSISWVYNWNNLPRVDTEGNKYAYKLEETKVQDGFVSATDVKETENEKVYRIGNYRAAETKIAFKVTKAWYDEDGETPLTDDENENLPDYVDFQLFRVVSREPYAVRPTSGGNPYIIENSRYYQPNAEKEGTYRIEKALYEKGIVLGEGTNNRLVSVEEIGGIWYYYSYYVKELPVPGYNSSLQQEVNEVEEGTNYTTVLQTMKNTKKPDERTTDLSVQKVWKDKGGNNKSWPSGMTVRFKLYQVTGKTPFNTRPDSGGTLYDVKNQNNYHDARVEEGTYELNSDRTGVTFTGLPEVTYDARGRATYYAYYVDEVEVTGYGTTYDYDTTTEPGKVSVTISNQQEPDFTRISVEKKWYDSNGETELTGDAIKDLEATVELVRYRSEPTGTTVHFVQCGGSELYTLLVPRNQSGVDITIDSIDGGANIKITPDDPTGKEFWEIRNLIASRNWTSAPVTMTIDTPNSSDIYVVFGDGTVTQVTASTTSQNAVGDAALDPTFNSDSNRVTLNNGNSFSHVFTRLLTTGEGSDDGKTYVYTYGVREVSNPTGFAFDSYITADSNAADTGHEIPASNPASSVTVKNVKKETSVSLDILKVDKNDSRKLNGAVFGLIQIDGTNATISIIGSEQTVTTAGEGADQGKATFSNLAAGYYRITEKTPPEEYVITGDAEFFIEVTDEGVNLLTKGEGTPDSWPKDAVTYGNVKTFKAATAYANAQATVENTTGAALPNTGGPGTNLIYLFGIILTALAGAGLVIRRRRRV